MTGTTIRLEFDEAVSLLREVVAEKGDDYVYEKDAIEGCVYFGEEHGKTEQPSCIVGHVLAKKGVHAQRAYDGDWNTRTGAVSLFDTYDVLESEDGRVQNLLMRVQDEQDRGKPWGKALDTALEFVHETQRLEAQT